MQCSTKPGGWGGAPLPKTLLYGDRFGDGFGPCETAFAATATKLCARASYVKTDDGCVHTAGQVSLVLRHHYTRETRKSTA